MTDWTFGLIPGLIGDAFKSDNSTPPPPAYISPAYSNPYAPYAAQLNALQPGSASASSAPAQRAWAPQASWGDMTPAEQGFYRSTMMQHPGDPSLPRITGLPSDLQKYQPADTALANPYAQYSSQLAALGSGSPAAQAPAPTPLPAPLNIHPSASNPYANFDFSKLSYNPTPSGGAPAPFTPASLPPTMPASASANPYAEYASQLNASQLNALQPGSVPTPAAAPAPLPAQGGLLGGSPDVRREPALGAGGNAGGASAGGALGAGAIGGLLGGGAGGNPTSVGSATSFGGAPAYSGGAPAYSGGAPAYSGGAPASSTSSMTYGADPTGGQLGGTYGTLAGSGSPGPWSGALREPASPYGNLSGVPSALATNGSEMSSPYGGLVAGQWSGEAPDPAGGATLGGFQSSAPSSYTPGDFRGAVWNGARAPDGTLVDGAPQGTMGRFTPADLAGDGTYGAGVGYAGAAGSPYGGLGANTAADQINGQNGYAMNDQTGYDPSGTNYGGAYGNLTGGEVQGNTTGPADATSAGQYGGFGYGGAAFAGSDQTSGDFGAGLLGSDSTGSDASGGASLGAGPGQGGNDTSGTYGGADTSGGYSDGSGGYSDGSGGGSSDGSGGGSDGSGGGSDGGGDSGGGGRDGGGDGGGRDGGGDGGGDRRGGPIGAPTDQPRPVKRLLHTGEYVIRPEAVRMLPPGLLDAINAMGEQSPRVEKILATKTRKAARAKL